MLTMMVTNYVFFVVGSERSVELMTFCDGEPCPHLNSSTSCIFLGTNVRAMDFRKYLNSENRICILCSPKRSLKYLSIVRVRDGGEEY